MGTKNHLDEEGCWQLFEGLHHGNLAGVSPRGVPILRSLNHAVLDGALYFHGALRGEKTQLIGQSVVFGCEEVVAQIPSYWRDPINACPATTWYRSAQAHGRLELVEDVDQKARVLEALMQRLQPEGGYKPIEAQAPEYVKMLPATLVARLVPNHLTGRSVLGQGKKPDDMQGILEGLWERGTPEDLRGLETIFASNKAAQRPAFLCGPEGIELLVCPSVEQSEEAALLLVDQYWNGPHDLKALAEAQRSATAWVGARDVSSGRLVGTAAALADRSKQAYIFDVAILPDFEGRGIGSALFNLLLDHPALRRTKKISLRTKDAQEFYQRFGFQEASPDSSDPNITTMLRVG